MSKIYSVYKITNSTNNKIYIGCTCNPIMRRLIEQRCGAKLAPTNYLQHAIREIGKEKFSIHLVYEAINEQEGFMVEKAMIASFGSLWPNGYNTTSGGRNGSMAGIFVKRQSIKRTGLKRSKDSCEHISIGRKGKAIGNQNALGKKWCKEDRAKHSILIKAIWTKRKILSSVAHGGSNYEHVHE